MKVYLQVCAVLIGAVLVFGVDLAPGGEKKGAAPSISQLVKDLSDKDADVRADAAEELGKKGPWCQTSGAGPDSRR